MISFLSEKSLRSKERTCIATLGIFDGLHRGHLCILKRLIKEAGLNKLKSLLITFNPHPLSFYNKKFPGYITTPEEKQDILRGLNLDFLWIIKFNKKISRMSGEDFIRYISRYFKIKKIIVGENFRFGHRAENTFSDLRKICASSGIKTGKLKKQKLKNRTITSSLIRRLIKKADFEAVGLFLGRNYSYRGRIERGNKAGAELLGVPTINILPEGKILQPRGVYIVLVKYKNKIYQGVSNLGLSPVFKKSKITLETHIFNFNKNIYNQRAEIIFIKRLRPEKDFSSPAKLRSQIEKDIELARSHHNILSPAGFPTTTY